MKKIITLLLIGNLIFLTACWDMVELNERAFPYSIGLDLNNEGEEKFLVSFSHPNIAAIGDQAIDDELIHVISAKGDSFFEAAQNLTMELYLPFSFKHLKVVVMSRQLAENYPLFLEVLDGIQRDFITNNNANLLITESANELLKFTRESKIQQAIEGTIYSILRNTQNSNFFTPITTADFVRNTNQTGAAVIPLAGFEENISIGGALVFKDYKYVGDISPAENRTINLLNNEIDNDQFDVEHKGITLSLMATEGKTRRRLVDKENLVIKLDVELEGHIHSHTMLKDHEVTNEKILEELEEMAVERIEENIQNIIKKLQKELNSDLIFISDYLRKFHPNIWEEIEEDYGSIFPNMTIETEVKFNIRRRGLIQ